MGIRGLYSFIRAHHNIKTTTLADWKNKKLGIDMVYGVGKGGKVRSSSDLLKAYSKKSEK